MNYKEEYNYGKIFYDNFDYSMFESNNFSENNQITFKLNNTGILKTNLNYAHYLCPKCKFFPYIQIVNQNEMYYNCGCTEKKGELIDIKEFVNKKKEYSKANLNKDKNNDLYKKEGLRCLEHNHKFRYYCIDCHINLCKECCEFHLNKSHDLIIFDFNDFDIRKKINKILYFSGFTPLDNKRFIKINFYFYNF